MRILFIVPYAPTPIRTRPYNLLRVLARRGHVVTLATLWENEQERAALVELEHEGICVLSAQLAKSRALWNTLCALPTRRPLQARYCWHPELMKQISSSVQSPTSCFDLIHVEHLRGAEYGLSLKRASHLPIVLDSVDCISYLFEQAVSKSESPFGQWMTRFELLRTPRYEAELLGQFDRILITSESDKHALEMLRRDRAPILVVPNGVDLMQFSPLAEGARDANTIVFSGKMSYHANVTAAMRLVREIMPLVWKERPDVRVQIVGKDPPASVSKLGAAFRNRIFVTGTVPDVRPYLQHAAIAVAPMPYGAGIQNKVLEAMACATPVVCSPQAASALSAQDGADLVIAEDAESFAREVLCLLSSAELRQRVGQGGRRYVERCHDWGGIVAHLEQIYQEVTLDFTNTHQMPVLKGA